ncbi:Golgi apparatus membrane protein tvp38 [Teratosphaeria destructans]|uniref:Golgi apparatus membrane protein TVP38 n=1 Tax=Teratosphaeria destructans TaxID=418781 RepID=A0A9W7SPB2_9PEZI|nr:Golgi apparatus membrane protein tvp38 [Teratosphaeria destructans]
MAGPNNDYADTARALASEYHDDDADDDDDDAPRRSAQTRRSHSTSPLWQRRSTSQPRDDHGMPRWRQRAESMQRRALKLWSHLTPVQRAGLGTSSVILAVLIVLGVVYNERIFHALAPAARRWREMPAGWVILWAMTFVVSFPPMIGYSTCVTIAGFVFGLRGWWIMSTASVAGSTAAFLASRTVLRPFVSKLTEKNKKFSALSLVLKHDGLKLLVMIRLCPLPYSISNGAISTIPTVTWPNFMIATAIASPKLLLHIFVGSRLGDIAENGDKMDVKTKVVSYLSILIGVLAGIATGYFIYVRTQARAKQLEAEEAAATRPRRRRVSDGGTEYIDDPDEGVAVDDLRRYPDDVSLHTTYEEDLERGGVFTDEFTDEEDARQRDVFDEGDGETEDEDDNDLKSRQ